MPRTAWIRLLAWLLPLALASLACGQGPAGGASPDAALQDLRSDVAATRFAAVRTLAAAGEAARPVLEQLMASPDWAARADAVSVLGAMAQPDAELLARAVADPESIVRRQALEALRLRPTPAGVTLAAGALGDADDAVRALALRVLAELPEDAQAHVASVAACLGDDDEAVRRWATSVLITLGEPAVPELIEMLESGNGTARWRAAYVLGEIGAPAHSAVGALKGTLEDDDPRLRRQASVALERIGAL